MMGSVITGNRRGAIMSKAKTAEFYIDRLIFDPRWVDISQKIYSYLPVHLREPQYFSVENDTWKFDQLDEAGERLNVYFKPINPKEPRIRMLETPNGKREILDLTAITSVPRVDIAVTGDKSYSNEVLNRHGISAPKSAAAANKTQALEVFKKFKCPIVLKPRGGSLSKGVTTNITSEGELIAAYDSAEAELGPFRCLIEEYIPGVDLRVLLAGGKVRVAYLRIFANVVGDGEHSISKLVDNKNKFRKTLPNMVNESLIPKNELAKEILKHQGMDLESVPPKGKLVLLGIRPNLSDGADLVPITELLHPGVVALCESITSVFDDRGFWGLDLLCEDFTKPPSEKRSAICDINSRPTGGVMVHTTHGQHYPFFNDCVRQAASLETDRGYWPDSENWTLRIPNTLKLDSSKLNLKTSAATNGWNTFGFKGSRKDLFEVIFEINETTNTMGCISCHASDQVAGGIKNRSLKLSTDTFAPIWLDEGDINQAVAKSLHPASVLLEHGIAALPKQNGYELANAGNNTRYIKKLHSPKNYLARRELLNTRGISMTPLRPIWSMSDLDEFPETIKGQIYGFDPVSKLWFHRFNSLEAAKKIANRLQPSNTSPLYLSPWHTLKLLNVVFGYDKVLAVALRAIGKQHNIDNVPSELRKLVENVRLAIPGLNFGRLVFRLTDGPETQDKRHWYLHDTKNIAHKDFATPATGMPVNIPMVMAKLIQENEKKYFVSKDALALA